MAKPKYSVCVPITSQDGLKTRWHTIGAAWETEKGGISITLNSLPTTNKVMLFPRVSSQKTAYYKPKSIGLGPFDGVDDGGW